MIVYLMLLMLCTVFSLCDKDNQYIPDEIVKEKKGLRFNLKIKIKHNDTQTAIWLILTFLFLLFGLLRDPEMSYDNTSYYRDYFLPSHADIHLLLKSSDPGFYLISWLISKVWYNYQFFRGIIFALTFLPYAVYVKKESNNIGYSYLLYVLFQFIAFNYGILRQSMAITICILAWHYANENKWIRCALLIAIATSIHTTAIVMTVPFVILHLPQKIRRKAEFIGVAVCVYVVFISSSLFSRLISMYTRSEYITEVEIGHGRYQFAAYTILCLAMFIFLKASKEKYKKYEKYFDVGLCGLLIQMAALKLAILGRAGNYIWILYTVELTHNSLRKDKRRILYLFIAGVMLPFYLYSLIDDRANMIPYRFFF